MDLPNHLFHYISSITPLVSVELIITTPSNLVILAWRDDGMYGPGWHLPGGVLRHKESLIDRIRYVALHECSIESFSSCDFLQVNQVMNPERDIRGHFISLLFHLTIDYTPGNINTSFSNGSLGLFSSAPNNLISQHLIYSDIINSCTKISVPFCSSSGNVCNEYSP